MRQRSSIYQALTCLGMASVLSCNQAPPAPAIVAADTDTVTVTVPAKPNQPVLVARQAPVAPPTKSEPGKNEFAFPDDNGGKLLAKMLPPASPPSLPAIAAEPRERTLPAYLDAPTLPTDDAANAPATLRSPDGKVALPNALPDRVPLELAPPLPILPERTPLPTGPLTRDMGRDVNIPADLPFLSPLPLADRASLADPTVEFTAQNVISLTLPLRTETVGFIRYTLPDPFEHSATARPQTPITDEPNRVLGTPPPPRP